MNDPAVLTGTLSAFAQDRKPAPSIKMTVKGMCCAKEAAPVVKELEKVKGVQQVTADPKAGTLTIVPVPKLDPSPKEIWEAVERSKLQPVKLATADETFTKKPKR